MPATVVRWIAQMRASTGRLEFAAASRFADMGERVWSLAVAVGAVSLLGSFAARTGLWCDELSFLRAIHLGLRAGLTAVGSSHPPLMRLLAAPCAGAASDLVVRLPSLVCAFATVLVWSRLLRCVMEDRATRILLLPAMALNATWLALAYLLLPYALLVFLASLHAWSWFRLLEKPDAWTVAVFALSGAACAWTHFFGFDVLAADQVVWLLLVWTKSTPERAARWWAITSASAWILAAPIVPLLVYFAQVDRPYPIESIKDFATWFPTRSARIFDEATFYRLQTPGPLWLLGYAAVGALVWLARRSARRGDKTRRAPTRTKEGRVAQARAAGVVIGGYLAGLPAVQVYSLLTRAAISERYIAAGAWVHVPLFVLCAAWLLRSSAARILACGFLVLGLVRCVQGTGGKALLTLDCRPVVDLIAASAREGDAFWAQDMDLWIGDAQFDRLWFERYVHVKIPVINGPPMKRFDIGSAGLPFDCADPSVRRLFVFSHLFSPAWLADMPNEGARQWRFVGLHLFERGYALALYERETERR